MRLLKKSVLLTGLAVALSTPFVVFATNGTSNPNIANRTGFGGTVTHDTKVPSDQGSTSGNAGQYEQGPRQNDTSNK